MGKYFVYIIRSLKDNGYYVGMSSDIKKRLIYHNKGYVRSTKSRIPFKLIYFEEYKNRIEARSREKYLKSYEGSKEKLTIIDKIK